MSITKIITTKIWEKQQPYNPDMNHYNTHELTRRNKLILMMKILTTFGTSMNHPTVDMVAQNLSSASHPHCIFQACISDIMK